MGPTHMPSILQHILQSHHWSQIHTGITDIWRPPSLWYLFQEDGTQKNCSAVSHQQVPLPGAATCSAAHQKPAQCSAERRSETRSDSTSERDGAGCLWGPTAAHGQVMAWFSRNRDHFLCSTGSRAGRWARRGSRRKRQDANLSLKQIKYQKAAGSFETAWLLFWQRRKASH